MSLRSELEALLLEWNNQADTALSAGQNRIATNLYNSAEALEHVLSKATGEQPTPLAARRTLTTENGIHWPDGRIQPISTDKLDRWAGNPDIAHVTRFVTNWVEAPFAALAQTA